MAYLVLRSATRRGAELAMRVRGTDHRNVLRARVRIRVHGDRLDAEAARGAHHAARNLSAVCDQQLLVEVVVAHGRLLVVEAGARCGQRTATRMVRARA